MPSKEIEITLHSVSQRAAFRHYPYPWGPRTWLWIKERCTTYDNVLQSSVAPFSLAVSAASKTASLECARK